MIVPGLPRLSRELACKCASNFMVVDVDAPIGTTNACPTCGAWYINDNGLWRSVHTLSPQKRQKLRAIGHVQKLTEHLA